MRQYQWISLPIFGSYFSLMIVILESKQERIMKGMMLILFGMFFGIYLPEAIIPSKEVASAMPKDLVENIEILKNLVIFSCSGAGGSIIAGHAERFLSPVEVTSPAEIKVVDNTAALNAMMKQMVQIKQYIMYFAVASFILLCTLIALVI